MSRIRACAGLIAIACALTASESLAGSGTETGSRPAETAVATPATFAGWLERVARAYQDEIATKLSTARAGAAAVDTEHDAPAVSVGRLSTVVGGALNYVAFWVAQAAHHIGGQPLSELAFAIAETSAQRAAREAEAFVAERRKAEAEWKTVVAQADAAADAARKGAAGGAPAGSTPAESELERAEARKEELSRIKKDLDRRIEEGLKKLEEFETQNKLHRSEMLGVLRTPRGETVAAAQAEAEKARAAEAEAQAQTKRAAENKAREEAEAQKRRADAEAASRKDEAERARIAAENESRVVEQARALADAARKAEDARLAAAEAARKAEDERKAAEAEKVRLAESDRGRREAAEKEMERARREYQEKIARAEAEADGKAAGDDKRAAATGPDVTADSGARRLAEPQRSENENAPVPSKGPAVRAAKSRAGEVTALAIPRNTASRRPHAQKAARKKTVRIAEKHWAGKQCARKKYERKGARKQQAVKRSDTLWKSSKRQLKAGQRYRAIRRADGRKSQEPQRLQPCQKQLSPSRA